MKTRKKIAATNKLGSLQKNATGRKKNKKFQHVKIGHDEELQMHKTLIPSDWLNVLLSRYLSSYLLFFSINSMSN
jgi:hypothetical protein